MLPAARSRLSWQPQPLCAAYRRTAIRRIREALDAGDSAVIQALPRLWVETIGEEDLAAAGLPETIFENMNDPQGWERIQRLRAGKAE